MTEMETQETELIQLYKEIIENERFNIQEKTKLLDEVRKIKHPQQNRWNYWYVIFALALISFSTPIAYALKILTGQEATIPEGLLSLSSTAVGALAGFLTASLKNN
nr:hypothetical protein [uncultured Desulfobacter sp.]